ncbi:MAG TPA: GNAT family N-acetyltransferase, partial [Vineibacter sp.]|nr:GNAT family N-acetyltransferase [Vineibacter sp.]
MTGSIAIAPLTAMHADAAHGLTTAVGWSHRREDWLLALSAGQGLGAYDAIGALRGTLVWFPYAPAHASVGLIVVDPALQRGGVGRALMRRLFDDAGERSLLLVSTEAGLRLYENLGFRTIGSNAAHMGTVTTVAGPHDGVERGHASDLQALQALDAAAMGCR